MKHNFLFAIPAALIVGLGVFAFSTHAQDAPKQGAPRVGAPIPDGILAHRCNNRGEVDALVFHVSQAGTYTLKWDNIKLCGVRV